MTSQILAQPNKSTLLRRTLQANGLFSGISGIICLAGVRVLTPFFGLGTPLILVVVGGGCLLYAISLFFSTRQELINPLFARFTVIADTTWVLGSLIILFTGWPALTSAGWWTVAIIADIVAVFAALQYYGLRQVSGK